MSRDLGFWRVNKNLEISNQEIYRLLSNEEYVPNIEELPLDEILEDFSIVFNSWKNESEGFFEEDGESFQLMISKQFVRVDCYNVKALNLNSIIDILRKYECPLYDPTIDVRFDSQS
jgi:hypothetical protein